MNNDDIKRVLESGQDVVWFRNTGDGRIKTAVEHVAGIIAQADPGQKTWKRLTPEQVRELISPSRPATTRKTGGARKEPAISGPAPVLVAPSDEFGYCEAPAKTSE